jgi:hypothetical protein
VYAAGLNINVESCVSFRFWYHVPHDYGRAARVALCDLLLPSHSDPPVPCLERTRRVVKSPCI